MPKLFETLQKDEKFTKEISQSSQKAMANPFFQRVMKEALLSDSSLALGKVHDAVIEAALPELVGRELVQIIETEEPFLRIFKAKKGKAYRSAQLSTTWVTGESYETQDVKADKEIRAIAEFTKRFLEDAKWPVMERQAKEVGRAIGEMETTEIKDIYEAISASDLASGAEISATTPGTLAYGDVLKAWKAVKAENFNPTVLAVSPNKAGDLWDDDKFIHSFYFGELQDKERGIFGSSILGFKVVVSSILPDNRAHMIDVKNASVMLLRRDIMIEPYGDLKNDAYGIVASERIGLAVLRTKAVARVTI